MEEGEPARAAVGWAAAALGLGADWEAAEKVARAALGWAAAALGSGAVLAARAVQEGQGVETEAKAAREGREAAMAGGCMRT